MKGSNSDDSSSDSSSESSDDGEMGELVPTEDALRLAEKPKGDVLLLCCMTCPIQTVQLKSVLSYLISSWFRHIELARINSFKTKGSKGSVPRKQKRTRVTRQASQVTYSAARVLVLMLHVAGGFTADEFHGKDG